MSSNAPTSVDFQMAIAEFFQEAQHQQLLQIEIKSGELHRRVGGYPSHNHRMPICCSVMRANMQLGDQIIASPPKGDGATLVIRYLLPRGD